MSEETKITIKSNDNINDDENNPIYLQLSDIIKLTAPNNEILNDQIFIVDYIDKTKIILINVNSLEKTILQIKPDGSLSDDTITTMDIDMSQRSKYPGYAMQNNLKPQTWINIYFGGEIPTIITGEITNLEEDMIEITTYPDKQTMYINFNYSGIPEDLPIETIEIRPPIDTKKLKSISNDIQDNETLAEFPIEKSNDDKLDDNLGDDSGDDSGDDRRISDQPEIINQDDDNEVFSNIPMEKVKDHIREFIIQGDEISFGLEEKMGTMTEYKDKAESKLRYSIEMQCNDLLDDLLSTIPDHERTDNVLYNLHIMIERFKQLRCNFSTFDNNDNITSFVTNESNPKPLIKQLTSFNKSLQWILPVVENIKKVYDINANVEDYNDITHISLKEDLANIQQEFNFYKSNSFPDEQNKYFTLINNINSEFTPFELPNPEYMKNIIYQACVNNEINTIVDNLGDLYSNIVHKNMIKSNRFVLQKYNLGLKRLAASTINNIHMIAEQVQLTPNDDLTLRSIITLPEPVIRYSRINLPGTNILERTNLSATSLNYWQLFHKNTQINKVDMENNNQTNVFANKINNYTLTKKSKNNPFNNNLYELEEGEIRDTPDENTSSNENITSEEYDIFLQKIIPTNQVLFGLTKKYIKGSISFVNIVSYLEPFLVYSTNITYNQYINITKFIDSKISEYNKLLIERGRNFSKLNNIKYNIKMNPSTSAIYSVLRKLSDSVFQNGYDYNKGKDLTNSELIAKMMTKDSGRLYNSALCLENVPLLFSNNLASLFEQDITSNKELLEEYSNKNQCKTYVIAKQYKSLEEIEMDNNKEIYFDKKYDKTQYSLQDHYAGKMSTQDPNNGIDFIVKDLQKKQGLSLDDAIYVAESLITGMKKVKDGQYAFFYDFNDDSINYYVRKNNTWVIDEDIDKSYFITDDNLLCNMQQKCIDVNNKCESTDLNKAQMENSALKSIMNEFDTQYNSSKENLEKEVKARYDYLLSISDKLTSIEFYNKFKYNNRQVNIGNNLDAQDKQIIISPYQPWINLILGQPDFVKKQRDIIRFTMNFTREALENTEESIHWRYCIKTGVELLPSFYYSIASVFVNDPDNYIPHIESLKHSIGKISDDGNDWVDKHSGRVIQRISFSTEEEYQDGFKVKSREIMEKDAGTSLIGNIKSQLKKQSHEIRVCSNIITTMASNMGINLEDQREFIITNTTSVFLSNMIDEIDYNRNVKEASKRGKSLPSYNDFYNTNLLYMTLAMILIGIQVNVPSIKTRKTYPGCVQSFSGFPMEGGGDDSAVEYIACVAYHTRSTAEPWKVLMKKKQSTIVSKLKKIIEDYFIQHTEIQYKFQEKAEYLLTAPIDTIPDEHSISKWSQFLPPLVPIKLSGLANITSEFKSKLLRDLKGGFHAQRGRHPCCPIQGHLFPSLGIQEQIQNIVDKKTPILKNMINDPFLENACCNEKDNGNTTIGYFINEDKEILSFNSIVTDLCNILDDVNVITKASLYYSPLNTKVIYPPVSKEFNETTIYRGFVVYCNFNTIFPVPEYLIKYCDEKPMNIKPTESLNEMIIKLKADGRNYNNKSLLHLYQLVSRENIFRCPITYTGNTPVQMIRDILEKMDDNNEEIIYPSLRRMLEDKLDVFDLIVEDDGKKSMRDVKNHLARTNQEMRSDIIKFIKENTNLLGSKKKNMDELFDDIMYFYKYEDHADKIDMTNNSTYNFIQFIKNNIHNITTIFPTMILNHVDYENADIPKYWGLSNYHNTDIKNIINMEYESLRIFYSNPILVTILQTIQDKTDPLFELAFNTFYFTDINYNDTSQASVFDERTSILLFEHYFLLVLNEYINLTHNDSMLFQEETQTQTLEDVFVVENLDDDLLNRDITNQVESRDVLLQGNKKELKINVANLLLTYLNMIKNNKKNINYSYDEIMDKVFKLKERERGRTSLQIEKRK